MAGAHVFNFNDPAMDSDFEAKWSDPSDQFFSFVSVGGFVNCANPSSADFTCPAYGPFGSNCKYLW